VPPNIVLTFTPQSRDTSSAKVS